MVALTEKIPKNQKKVFNILFKISSLMFILHQKYFSFKN